MKKLLLLFAVLLGVVGAWAEVTPLKVSTGAEKYYYVIKNFRSHKFAYYNGDDAQLLQQTNPTSATTQDNLNKYMWYVTEAEGEGAYMLHNVATEKVYAAYNSFTEEGAVVYIKENPYKSGYVCVSSNSDAKTENTCWDDQGSQTKIGPYETRQNDNAGTSWEFIEITQNTDVTYTLSDNADNSFSGSFTGWNKEMLPAITGVAGYSLSNVAFEDNSLNATINFPFPVSKVDGTTNWTFIRSQAMTDGKAYLYVNSDGKVVTKSQHSGNGTYGYLPTGVEGDVQKWMWAIYPKLTDDKFTFQIKNASTNKFAPSVNGQTKPFNVSETAGDYSWGTCTGGANGFYLDGTTLFIGANSSSAGEQEAIIWDRGSNNSHKGCNLEFTEPVYAANVNIEDNNNTEYTYFATVAYTPEDDVERPVITGIFDSWIANTQWSEGTCTISLNFPFTPSSATKANPIQIANWGAKDDANKKRWHAVLEEGVYNVKAQTAVADINDWGTWLWEIYPICDNGAFTYVIKNAHTGTYVNVDPTKESAQGAKGYVTLSETPTTFSMVANGNYINWGYTGNSKTLKLTTNGGGDTNVYLGSYSGTHEGNHIAFPALTKFNLTVGTTGYASLYTPIAGTFAGEIKTYAIKKTTSNYATLTELTGIAANQGAIIEAAPGTYTFTAGDVSSDWEGNKLTGTSVNTYVEGEAYVLGNTNTDGIGLYKAALNKDADGETGTTHFLNNAGKAYLPVSALTAEAAEARFFVFDFGGNETAIESVEAENAEQNAVVYDLAGRRVQGAQKGIFIVNGKKIIK